MADEDTELTPPVRRVTGPRTLQGKGRSKHNALKHGIFSKVVLLENESKVEFDSLLDGLREDFEPEGMIETVLVEKLAMLVWRHRRLLIAEDAEIQSDAKVLEWDRQTGQFDEAEEFEDQRLVKEGRDIYLMGKSETPTCLKSAWHVSPNCAKKLKCGGSQKTSI
jgi:hypothetical protein